MKKLEPRKYQKQAVRKARSLAKKAKRVLIVSPGGSGKTLMAVELARLALNEKKTVLYFTHRRELVNQCYDHMLRRGIDEADIGTIVSGDDRENMDAPIQLATINSLYSQGCPDADVLILDEAHHVKAPTYESLIDYYADADIFGLTATPYRMDNMGLEDVFDVLVDAIKPSELIANKWLAKPKIFAADEKHLPDLRRLKTYYGDYSLVHLEKRVNKGSLIGNIVDHWFKHAEDRTTLVYAATIKHSKSIVAKFRKRGVKVAHLDGKMSVKRRETVLQKFADKKIQVLSSCMLLTEGYDLPQCGAVILARPTRSMALATQQVNRGLRYYRGIRPIILDHAAYYHSFGLPYADREYSLHRTHEVEVKLSLAKSCPICGLVSYITDKYCAECGYKFRVSSKRKSPQEKAGELEQLTPGRIADFKCRLKRMAEQRGFPRLWVETVMAAWVEARS